MNCNDRKNLVVLPAECDLKFEDVIHGDSSESLSEELNCIVNPELERASRKEFSKSDAVHAVDNIDSIFELLSDAFAAIRKGEAPEPFGMFFTGEISRILSAQLFILCTQFDCGGMSDEEVQSGVALNRMIYLMEFDTNESIQRIELISSMAKFLKTAAALAKSVDQSSANDFMSAWEVFDHYERFIYSCASDETADEAAELIDTAISKLRAALELKKSSSPERSPSI